MTGNCHSQERKYHGTFALNDTQNCHLTVKTAQLSDLQQRAHRIRCNVYTQIRAFELRSEECAQGEGLHALFRQIQSNPIQ